MRLLVMFTLAAVVCSSFGLHLRVNKRKTQDPGPMSVELSKYVNETVMIVGVRVSEVHVTLLPVYRLSSGCMIGPS
jgi:hypothetical protein